MPDPESIRRQGLLGGGQNEFGEKRGGHHDHPGIHRQPGGGHPPRLNAIYDTIRAAIPEAEERMSWGMPTFAERVGGLSGNEFLRAVFAGQNAMIDYDHNDTWLTACDQDSALPDKVRALAAAEGLFVWRLPQEEAE